MTYETFGKALEIDSELRRLRNGLTMPIIGSHSFLREFSFYNQLVEKFEEEMKKIVESEIERLEKEFADL